MYVVGACLTVSNTDGIGSRRVRLMTSEHDYVVIGAGSAGCVVASRLSEDPSARVLLLEAGPRDRANEIKIAAAFSKLFKSRFDWGYSTTPQAGLQGRRIYYPRARCWVGPRR